MANRHNTSTAADMIAASIAVVFFYLAATTMAGVTIGIIWGVASSVGAKVVELI